MLAAGRSRTTGPRCKGFFDNAPIHRHGRSSRHPRRFTVRAPRRKPAIRRFAVCAAVLTVQGLPRSADARRNWHQHLPRQRRTAHPHRYGGACRHPRSSTLRTPCLKPAIHRLAVRAGVPTVQGLPRSADRSTTRQVFPATRFRTIPRRQTPGGLVRQPGRPPSRCLGCCVGLPSVVRPPVRAHALSPIPLGSQK